MSAEGAHHGMKFSVETIVRKQSVSEENVEAKVRRQRHEFEFFFAVASS